MNFEQKALRLKKTFFTEPLALTNEDIIDYVCKNAYKTQGKMNINKICGAINELFSRRICRIDNISSKILKVTKNVIMLHMYLEYNTSFKFGYCSHHFK